MSYDAQTRIGDVVLEQPAAMRVFESLNMDYCCGGHKSLQEASAHAGVGLDAVLERLAGLQAGTPSPSDPAAWKDAPLSSLIGHLETTHHVFTRTELARVEPLMEKVLRVHGDHHPELARIAELFAALRDDLLPHLEKEERILFPYIRSLEAGKAQEGCFGSVAQPIYVMQMEHEAAGDVLRELKTLTRDYQPPADACGSFRSLYMGLQALEADLHLHIYLESHILFPRALDAEDR
jgi:regulator of cell morphogenesis and NO signaling